MDAEFVIPFTTTKPVVGGTYHGKQWRWALFIATSASRFPLDILLTREASDDGVKFYPISSYFDFNLRLKNMKFGRDHLWYDGPHDSLHLGPINFAWSWWSCEKCEEGI
jgi:hypothetical protein